MLTLKRSGGFGILPGQFGILPFLFHEQCTTQDKRRNEPGDTGRSNQASGPLRAMDARIDGSAYRGQPNQQSAKLADDFDPPVLLSIGNLSDEKPILNISSMFRFLPRHPHNSVGKSRENTVILLQHRRRRNGSRVIGDMLMLLNLRCRKKERGCGSGGCRQVRWLYDWESLLIRLTLFLFVPHSAPWTLPMPSRFRRVANPRRSVVHRS